MADNIHLELVTPERRVVVQDVDELVLPGAEGYVGVLPGHAPLLTSLGVGELMYRTGQKRQFAAVSWGFAEILGDRVTILADIAERADEIDAGRAEDARKRAEGRLTDMTGSWDIDRARVALMKSMSRLQVAKKGAA